MDRFLVILKYQMLVFLQLKAYLLRKHSFFPWMCNNYLLLFVIIKLLCDSFAFWWNSTLYKRVNYPLALFYQDCQQWKELYHELWLVPFQTAGLISAVRPCAVWGEYGCTFHSQDYTSPSLTSRNKGSPGRGEDACCFTESFPKAPTFL